MSVSYHCQDVQPLRFTVILVPEDKGFSVAVPAMPGCASLGRTRDEALANAREAMNGWMEVEAEQGRAPLPETPALIARAVEEAARLIDEMRAAGEVAPGRGYDLELATVEIGQAIAA